jgi:diguanylate cyclase (GGDEF)-like protein
MIEAGETGMTALPKTARFSNWAIGALAAFLLFYLSWQAFHWLPGGRVQIGDLFFLPIGAAAVLASLQASRRCAQHRQLCWFWRLFALGLGAQLLGDTAMAIYDLRPGALPFPSLVDPPYLAFYVLMGLALLRVPLAPPAKSERTRIALDLAVAIIGGWMAIWYLVLAPTVTEGGMGALQMATSIAYPVGDVVLLAGLGVVVLRWSPLAIRRPLGFIVGGLSLFILADLAYGYALLHGTYAAGGPIDMLWIGALALFTLAATQQREARPGTAETSIPLRAPTESKVSWLPFGALAVGSATLLSSQWENPFVLELSLVAVAIALAALIALRQYLAQGEMIRLQGELRDAHEEMAKLASEDPLTGMANRRSFDEILEQELERANRYGRALSILFIDVDRFKAVNDDYGHTAGDNALKEFGSVMRDCLRSVDYSSRWGGEEFVVLLPETGSVEALRAAERIRASVEGHEFSFGGERGLTCSIGASSWPDDARDARGLLRLADDAVYDAKREGRNRVMAASNPVAA